MKDTNKITRVRSIWERQARAALGNANREVAEAERAALEALDNHRKTVAEAGGENSPEDLMMRRIAGMATHEKYTAAELVRGHADQRARAVQGAWRRSAQELEVAERLDERRRQALAYLARRSAESTLDELMTLRRKGR